MAQSSLESAVAFVEELKAQGNQLVAKGNFVEAAAKYSEALEQCRTYNQDENGRACVENSDTSAVKSSGSKASFDLLHVQLCSNRALCHLKNGDDSAAVVDCNAALEKDTTFSKAYYRRALGYDALGRPEDALRDVARVLQLEPSDVRAKELFGSLRQDLYKRNNKLLEDSLPDKDLKMLADSNALLLDRASAAARLQTSALKRQALSVLVNCGAVVNACKMVKELVDSNALQSGSTEDRKGSCIALLTAMRLLLVSVVEDSESECTVVELTGAQGESSLYRKTDKLHKPIESSPRVVAARKVIQEHFTVELKRSVGKILYRGELSDAGVDEDSLSALGLRTTPEDMMTSMSLARVCTLAALALVRLIQYCESLDCRDALEVLSEGLCATLAPQVQKAALNSLGYLADMKRRQGSKVEATKNSQPLMKCLEGAISLCTADDIGSHVEFAVVTCLALLADNDRNAADLVDMVQVAGLLLDPYMQSAVLDNSNLILGMYGLSYFYSADRSSCNTYVWNNNLLSIIVTAASDKSRQVANLHRQATEVLMLLMEFKELREEFIKIDAVEVLIFLASRYRDDRHIRAKIVGTMTRVALHGETVRQEIFSKVDFLELAQELLIQSSSSDTTSHKHVKDPEKAAKDNRDLRRSLLEILFFLSMHGSFKSQLLDTKPRQQPTATTTTAATPPPKIEDLDENPDPKEEQGKSATEKKAASSSVSVMPLSKKGIEMLSCIPVLGKAAYVDGDTASMYTYAGMVHNLLRSREDKDRIKRTSDMPMMESDELRQLRDVYEKLPEHAKPAKEAEFDRGGAGIAETMRQKLLDLQVCKYLCQFIRQKPSPTLSMTILAAESVRLFAKAPDRRGDVVKQGGNTALMEAVDRLDSEPDHCRDFRQALAQLAISINPALFTYRESLDMVPHLVKLLDDSYELYQYEAALGLTNLVSLNDEIRKRVFQANGWRAFIDIATSENDLLRAAGLEGLCNLGCLDIVQEKVAMGKMTFDLQILMSFLFEDDNVRARRAAAGCLAMLCSDVRVCWIMTKVDKFPFLVQKLVANLGDDTDLEVRLVSVIDCLIRAMDFQYTDIAGDSLKKNDGVKEEAVTDEPWRIAEDVRLATKDSLVSCFKENLKALSSKSQEVAREHVKIVS
eukprot:Lankesteria_metandrocarpae@DN2356_c0_g1_i1.p1